MLTNYHTHTNRCHHATGEDEEYVTAAIDAGFKTLGFSDHAPFYYPAPYVSYYKMTPDELPIYVNSIKSLRERYADKIEIHIGLEAEYYPELFDKGLELWRDAGIEYLILGQHFLGEEYGSSFHTTSPATKELLSLYTDTCIAAMKSGKFSYLAHPDMLNYPGDDAFYEQEVLRLTDCAVRLGIPLEVNLLGLERKRCYPRERFWEIASKLHPTVIIGNDAHEPMALKKPEVRWAAEELIHKYGLKATEKLVLKPL